LKENGIGYVSFRQSLSFQTKEKGGRKLYQSVGSGSRGEERGKGLTVAAKRAGDRKKRTLRNTES